MCVCVCVCVCVCKRETDRQTDRETEAERERERERESMSEKAASITQGECCVSEDLKCYVEQNLFHIHNNTFKTEQLSRRLQQERHEVLRSLRSQRKQSQALHPIRKKTEMQTEAQTPTPH